MGRVALEERAPFEGSNQSRTPRRRTTTTTLATTTMRLATILLLLLAAVLGMALAEAAESTTQRRALLGSEGLSMPRRGGSFLANLVTRAYSSRASTDDDDE